MSTITFPGLIDCHVHFREPGFPHKSTMASEAKAARGGGVLIACEMPNTNPPTTTVEAFADKVERASKVTDCDIRFYFGITEQAHIEELKGLWTNHPDLKARCSGVKLYLDHSTGDQKVDGGIVEDIFKICAELSIPLVAHCEDAETNEEAAQQNTSEDVSVHSIMRPPESEETAIAYAIGLARKHGTQFHVAHLSTKQGIDLVASAKAEGLSVTCEACPHHLFLTTDDYPTLGTHVKMNPPIRGQEHRDAVWQGIADGIVDCIATDHAPHTAEEKQAQPPLTAPSGVPGVATMIPLLLTVAAGKWPHPTSDMPAAASGFTYDDIERLCFTNPNTIFSLGASSDPVVTVDTEALWTVHAEELQSQVDWNPYEGWELTGRVLGVAQ